MTPLEVAFGELEAVKERRRLLAAVRAHERHRRGQGHQHHSYDLDLWRLADEIEGGTPRQTQGDTRDER